MYKPSHIRVMLSYNVEFIIVIKAHNILNDVFGQNVGLKYFR